jgi:phosphatidylserine/phosphatidylglycerophosphate/cardiolipin synthase-like enzyme
MYHRLITILLAVALFAFPAFAQPNQSIKVVFSSERGATASIVTLIGEATQSIRIAAYGFTSKAIANALVDAHKRGVNVQVVLDKSNAKVKDTAAPLLADGGIPTRIDYKHGKMHNKFMVVDDVTVETGSFNYTKSAEKNNVENIIIMRQYPEIAKQYLKHWQKLWDESENYKAKY